MFLKSAGVHIKHNDDPLSGWCLPASHSRQKVAPLEFEYMPASQGSHHDCPDEAWYFPASHSRQEGDMLFG